MPLQRPSRATGSVESLLAELSGRIEALFVFFSVPQQDAEDLLQDALLALVAKGPDVRAADLWLMQTLRNRCAEYWRRRRRWLYTELDEAFRSEECSRGVDPAERAGWRCDLNSAISRLPAKCRSMLQLRYGLGFETAEVATRMGYREGSVRKAEMRCLSALTREISALEPAGAEVK